MSKVPGLAPVLRDYWGQEAVLGVGGRGGVAFRLRANNFTVTMHQKYLDGLLLWISWHLLPSRDLLMDPGPRLKEH